MKINQRIRTKFYYSHPSFPGIRLGGFLGASPEDTYLGVYDDDRCFGLLSGQRLYRLAKAIVLRFESRK